MDAASGVTHKKIDEMEAIWSGGFKRARAAMGVTAFGMAVNDLPPNYDRVPPHVHTFDGQEEVYMVLDGSGWLRVADKRIPIDVSNAARIGPGVARSIESGPDGIRVLMIGGVPGKAYEPFFISVAGAPEPGFDELPGIPLAKDAPSTDDFTVMRYDEMGPMTGYFAGVTMFPVRRSLGVTAFGVNVIDIEYVAEIEGGAEHPLHDHADSGQEEVYVIAVGSGKLIAGDETVDLAKGEMVRVASDVEHKLVPDEGGLGVVAISAPPGGVYEPSQ